MYAMWKKRRPVMAAQIECLRELGVTAVSESLKSSAYKVLFRPQLEYCSTVWCAFTDSNISKREACKRRAARWVNMTMDS